MEIRIASKPTRKIVAHLNLKEGEDVILLERIRYADNQADKFDILI